MFIRNKDNPDLLINLDKVDRITRIGRKIYFSFALVHHEIIWDFETEEKCTICFDGIQTVIRCFEV